MSTATPRILIVGTGESGKSLLAKTMAKHFESGGYRVTVYDPIETEWSENAFVTSDINEFFEHVQDVGASGELQAVFVDEADTILSISDKANHWLLTRGRHMNITSIVITQRPKLVAPTVRTQCNELYCFKVARDDAKCVSEDFAHEDLMQAPDLIQGEYLRCYWKDKNKTVDKGRIF